jgi:hypothetical protein
VWWPETPSLEESFSTDASSIFVDDEAEETERDDHESRSGTASDGLGLVGLYQEDGHGGMKPFDGIGLLSRGVFINGHSTAHPDKEDDSRPSERLFSQLLDTFSTPARPSSGNSTIGNRRLKRDVAMSTISSELKCTSKAQRGVSGPRWRF